ncbi:MAG TPA: hypothetical protein VG917_05920 [Patescibacteria group bacterium]|nr:hypothetical protein [Patescibacteria group bacterium]
MDNDDIKIQTQIENSIPEETIVVPETLKAKPKFKLPLLVKIPLILLIVPISVFAGWFFIPRIFPPKLGNSISPIIDTSNWKTYFSDKYNYEFKYPPNVAGGSITYPDPAQDFMTVVDSSNKEIYVRVLLTNLQKIEVELGKPLGTITYNNQRWNVFLSSHPCQMACYAPNMVFYYLDFVTNKNNYTYEIEFNSNSDGSISSFQKTVISNFKFTDKKTADTSSYDSTWANWKKFNGDGFSIYYPNSWTIQKSDSAEQFYDPTSIQTVGKSFTVNGEKDIQLPTKYVYFNTINSTETTDEYINRQTVNNPAYAHQDVHNQFGVYDGVAIAGYPGLIYPALGEGSRGYIIVLSSSQKIVTINIPVSNPDSDPTISQILKTFTFAPLRTNKSTK